MLTIRLPIAPSANNAFFNRKSGGRGKSAKYRAWLKQADAYYVLQGLGHVRPIIAPYDCRMVFPKLRGDLDGRAKLILDWMVSRGLTPDDRFLHRLLLEKDEDSDLVWITVRDADARSQLPSTTTLLERPEG